MDIAGLINHPKRMDRDTLYELRSLLALHPYFQTVRLLLLQNLYLLHDPTFDEELRRAAIYITDRRVIFQMIEAGHYKLSSPKKGKVTESATASTQDSRTLSLIDDFLDSLPHEDETVKEGSQRKPTPADAAVDYVAYLLETESENDFNTTKQPRMKGQQLIDSFIEKDKGKIVLNENPTLRPEQETGQQTNVETPEENIYTETLAKIYIKQGNYLKALQIIKQLCLDYPKKNAYFADQIRFLQKLIINNNKKQ